MPEELKKLQIEYYFPQDIETKYVTHIVAQHTEQDFIISFFELYQPPLLGSKAEIEKQLENIDKVPAKCVVRIALTPNKMEEFLKVLNGNYKNYKNKFGEKRKDGSKPKPNKKRE